MNEETRIYTPSGKQLVDGADGRAGRHADGTEVTPMDKTVGIGP